MAKEFIIDFMRGDFCIDTKVISSKDMVKPSIGEKIDMEEDNGLIGTIDSITHCPASRQIKIVVRT